MCSLYLHAKIPLDSIRLYARAFAMKQKIKATKWSKRFKNDFNHFTDERRNRFGPHVFVNLYQNNYIGKALSYALGTKTDYQYWNNPPEEAVNVTLDMINHDLDLEIFKHGFFKLDNISISECDEYSLEV